MNARSSRKQWLQRWLHILVLLSLLLSPLQSIAAYAPTGRMADSPNPVGRVANSPYEAPSSGLFRTTITLRNQADWKRLEKLGVVVLERTAGGRTVDQQENADRERAKSAVILADDAQLEALARLRFESQGTDELGTLVLTHTRVML